MTTAIIVIWTIGLLGALAATAVILKESFLLIRTLRDTLGLARRTAEAARGVEANTTAVRSLAGIGEPLRPTDAALSDVAAALERLAADLKAVAR